MARPSLERNVKFKRLVIALGLPRPYVRGLLETMWDVAHECGNPVLGCADDVEAAAEWPGDPGVLFVTLSELRWIDEASNGVWQIHDYWHHAPDYVKKRRQREMERRTNGDSLAHSADNGRQRQTTADNGPTPAPAPAPNKGSVKDGAKRKRFTPPTLQDVAAYCRERSNSVDPQAWIDHYTANGWMVGKNKMRDWKAAVRTWERNEYGKSKRPSSTAGATPTEHPWHPDDVRLYSEHARWDDYMDAHEGTPAPWPRFEEWCDEL